MKNKAETPYLGTYDKLGKCNFEIWTKYKGEKWEKWSGLGSRITKPIKFRIVLKCQ